MSQHVVGLHAVGALLESEPARIEALWVLAQRKDRRLQRIVEQAQRAGIPVHALERPALDAMAGGLRHQGVMARYRGQVTRGEADLEALLDALQAPALVLVLDGIQDPHNLGACLRSADGAGAHAVVAPRDHAVGLTATVRKVASGAAESVPFFQVTNLARTLKGLALRNLRVIGTAGDADTSLFDADLRGPVALVLGAEESGLRRLTREHCDALVRIPMRGRVASLNVSVAASLVLYEALRQRRG